MTKIIQNTEMTQLLLWVFSVLTEGTALFEILVCVLHDVEEN